MHTLYSYDTVSFSCKSKFCTKPRFETEAARIFQRRMGEGVGGVTLCQGEGIHPFVMSISPSVVGRLLKKGLQSGLSRAP